MTTVWVREISTQLSAVPGTGKGAPEMSLRGVLLSEGVSQINYSCVDRCRIGQLARD